MRAAYVMRNVLQRWQQRIQDMASWEVHTAAQRRRIFLESFAHIPLKAFRIVSVVDERTYRLKHILKSITVKRSSRLDETQFRSFKYNEPKEICKLVDVMRVILEGDAIMLKALADRAKPPRWPNLEMSKKQFVEEEASTDEDDGEKDPRTSLGSGSSISVSQHMEFFLHRTLLIVWFFSLFVLMIFGLVQFFITKCSFAVLVLLRPAIAVLGFLPLNIILLRSVLTLYANVYLENLFYSLVSDTPQIERLHSRVPSMLRTIIWILLRRPPQPDQRIPSVLSNSLVDTFGTVGVIAVLDQAGIVTDMVLVPRQVLLLSPAPYPEEDKSSDEDDLRAEHLTGTNERAAKERQRELARQVRRKKFREQRFVDLALRTSAKEDLAVEFASRAELKNRTTHINPTCLCILFHALVKEPTNLSLWTEPFRLCDRTQRWARALHWLPRACNYDESETKKYRILARIFQIDTEMQSSFRSSYPEQASSLLVESEEDGVLHLFTMGTPFMVTSYCTLHWSGENVAEFGTGEKTEVTLMAKQQWEQGMCFETVALSHRLLPQRYHKYVSTLPRTKSTKYNEYFFCDGAEVTGPVPLRQRESKVGRCCSPRKYDRSRNHQKSAASHRRTASHNPQPTLRRPVPPHRSRSVGDEPSEKNGRLGKDDSLTMKTFMHLMVTCSQTFLSLVGLQDSVRPDVQGATAALSHAGVRCMYFCNNNGRQTRSFGSRVGLQTEWNCCISLKNESVTLDDRSIRAQLPFGISSIRKHLLHVDPIPLHVSLFSHAQGFATRSMLSILQDNHQVVLAVGSVFNHGNVRSFVQADLSIGVLPTRKGVTADKEKLLKHIRIVEPSDFTERDARNRDQSLYRNVAELIGCSCQLRAPPTVSVLPTLVTMIKESRLRLSGINNSCEFALQSCMYIAVLSIVSCFCSIQLLDFTATVVELTILIPLLSLSCTYPAYGDSNPIKTLPSRHNFFVRIAIMRHSTIVWSLRYIPSLLTLLVLGVSAATGNCQKDLKYWYSTTNDLCLLPVQGYVMLTLNFWMMIHSWTHISRYESIGWSFSVQTSSSDTMQLFRSLRIITVGLVTQLLSVGIVLLCIPWSKESLGAAFCPSIYHTLISLLFPVILILLDIPIKRWRKQRFTTMQKFRKLTFGTRLGMHSPRGDYEPEGASNDTVVLANSDTETSRTSIKKRLRESFFQFTSIHRGKLEMNCVCCDHIGGNYATYHVAGNV